nr:ribonuclease H-like domain-containing protein [Tanacetum cinerariifolium]
GNSQNHIDDKGYWDSGCSCHMTGTISYLSDYEPFDGGYVSFECIVLGRGFKLIDDTNVLLRTPRQHNMYSIDLNNIVPHKDLTCLVAKASADEKNLKDLKVKIIRCDNGAEFRNKEMNDFCVRKGIKREFSNPRTPQQNGVAKRRNRTLIEATRTMLADAKLPVTFWAKAVNTACYVQNRVLVNKSHNKTPYELFNVVVAGTNSTDFSGTKDATSQEVKKDVSSLKYIALPNWVHDALLESSSSNAQDTCKADTPESSGNPNPTATTTSPPHDKMETLTVETLIPTVSSPALTVCFEDSLEPSSTTRIILKRVTSQDVTPSLDNILTLSNRFDDILGVTTSIVDLHGEEDDVSNMETTITASPTPTLRIHKDHPKSQIIGPVDT